MSDDCARDEWGRCTACGGHGAVMRQDDSGKYVLVDCPLCDGTDDVSREMEPPDRPMETLAVSDVL